MLRHEPKPKPVSEVTPMTLDALPLELLRLIFSRLSASLGPIAVLGVRVSKAFDAFKILESIDLCGCSLSAPAFKCICKSLVETTSARSVSFAVVELDHEAAHQVAMLLCAKTCITSVSAPAPCPCIVALCPCASSHPCPCASSHP